MPSLELWPLTSFLSAPGRPNRPQVPTSSPCAPCQPSSWPNSSHKQWVHPSPSLRRQQSPWSPGSSLGLPSPVSQPSPALPGLPSYLPPAHLPDGPTLQLPACSLALRARHLQMATPSALALDQHPTPIPCPSGARRRPGPPAPLAPESTLSCLLTALKWSVMLSPSLGVTPLHRT